MESQICAEFHRISNINLKNCFYAELDRHAPRLQRLFRRKAAEILSWIFQMYDLQEQVDVHVRRAAVLRALPAYLHDDDSGFLKQWDVAQSEPDIGDLPVGLLISATSDAMYFCPEKVAVVLEGPDVVTVEEGDDVILPCSPSTKESITSKVFDWIKDRQKNRQEVFLYEAGIHYNNGRPGQDEQFKGRVSHFPEELKYGNASIMIRNTRKEDSGVYTCIFPRLQPSQTFYIKLVVIVDPTFKDRSGEIKGAAPKPYVTILNQTEDGMLLQCEVRGAFPKPKLHWQDSDGNILHAEEPKVTERGGSYDVILQTTVTKTDYYRCVATQEEISHQIYSETHVYISEKQVEDKSNHGAGLFVGGLFSGVLSLAAVQAVVVGVMCFIKRHKRGAARRQNVQTADEQRELELLPSYRCFSKS